MAQVLATPGVYIEEQNAFPRSIVGIPTAVPAFIGYTEKVSLKGQTLINQPVKISSITDYHNFFGGGFQAAFHIEGSKDGNYDFEIEGKGYSIVPENSSRFLLYDSLRLFFANGGTQCYVVSVGGYHTEKREEKLIEDKSGKGEKPAKTVEEVRKVKNTLSRQALEQGIGVLDKFSEPTLVVIPEAVMLEETECYALQQAMLKHCGYTMRNRFAILDVYNGNQARTSMGDTDVVKRFREGVGNNFLNYGAAYYPWVYTSIVQNDELSYKNITNLEVLEELLSKEAATTTENLKKVDEIRFEVKKLRDANVNPNSVNQTLQVISPTFKTILQKIKTHLNILPPSAGIAGIYASVDNTRGVWKAPANVGFASTIAPSVNITHEEQEDLNITVSGKSVNAIRSFIGEGTLVWGARTLDGNSADWRYINVRRTLMYIEQSIKNAAKAYVFDPNTPTTWILIRSMISTFLNDLWKSGGLIGTTPGDAYEVTIGLGSTMSQSDILDGIMRISVKVAISRPAEFIVISFQQKQGELS